MTHRDNKSKIGFLGDLAKRLEERTTGSECIVNTERYIDSITYAAAAAISSERAAHEQTKRERDALAHVIDPDDNRPALMARIIMKSIENSVDLEAAEARIAELEKALTALMELNDNHSPFGGELYQDRIDRTWDAARRALGGKTDD